MDSDTQKLSAIGSGALATVLKVNDQYAVKIAEDLQAAEHEINVLEEIGLCPCVVGYFGRLTCEAASVQRTALLLELCQGSLNNALLKLPGQRLPDAGSLTTQQAVVMMINCVAQLHGRGVIHQDIKPSNLLLGQDGAIKLCDFNLSRFASDSSRIKGGTVLYFSPHMFNNMDEGYAADWWALGVTLYQALHGMHTWPFSSRSLLQLDQAPAQQQLELVRKAVLSGNLKFRSLSGLPRGARALIRGLLRTQPEKRWGLLHVLAGDYPHDQAFTAVAAKYPQLGPDMERLLSLRRLCRLAPPKSVKLEAPALCEARSQATHCNDEDVKTGRGDGDGATSSAASSRRSLRGLSSYLLQRILSRRRACSSSSFSRDADDVSAGNDQRTPAAAATPSAAESSTATTEPRERDGRPHCHATGHAAHPAMRPRGGAAAKAVAITKSLLPRSEGAIRAAAAQAAAVAPRALLTEDGRLAPAGRHLPCEERISEVDAAALREVLQPLDPHGGEGAGGSAAVGGAGLQERNSGGQVQDIEVLEEMRQLLARRCMTAAAGGSGGSRAAGTNLPAGTSTGGCGHRASPGRFALTPSSAGGAASINTATASAAVASMTPGGALDSSCRSSTDTSNSVSSSSRRGRQDRSIASRAVHLGGGLQAAFDAAATAGYSASSSRVLTAEEAAAAALDGWRRPEEGPLMNSCALDTYSTSSVARTVQRQHGSLLDAEVHYGPTCLDCKKTRAGRGYYSTGHGLVRVGTCHGGVYDSPRQSTEESLQLSDVAAYAHHVDGALAIVRVSHGGSRVAHWRDHDGCLHQDEEEEAEKVQSQSQPGWPRVYVHPRVHVHGHMDRAGHVSSCGGGHGGVFSSCGMDSLFSLRGSTLMEELAAPAAPATAESHPSAATITCVAADTTDGAASATRPAPGDRHSKPVDLHAVAAGLAAAAANGRELMEGQVPERPTWGSGEDGEVTEQAADGLQQVGHEVGFTGRDALEQQRLALRCGQAGEHGIGDVGPSSGCGLPSPRVWAARAGQLLRKAHRLRGQGEGGTAS